MILRRRAAREIRGLTRRLAASAGATMEPRFLIIGTQRGGTTSLYEYLLRHRDVRRPRRKEIHFFDSRFARGLRWYRSQFPVGTFGSTAITGEATPYYLFHPAVPRRVASALPDVKIIILLRDPVARAYSQFQHNISRHPPMPVFEEALEIERRLFEGHGADPAFYDGRQCRLNSYVARGRYAEQLQRWLQAFPREQLLVQRSEDFYREPAACYAEVLDFLGLPPSEAPDIVRYNTSNYAAALCPATASALRDGFREPNRQLSELLDMDFSGWDD